MQSSSDLRAVAKAVIHPEGCEAQTLEYFLRTAAAQGPDGEALYCLRVDKRDPRGILMEREETPPLTSSLEGATKMASIFAAGTVTPCVLLEMADEWYDEILYKFNAA